MASSRTARIGVDVGGTFTDLVIFDPASGTVRLAKVPTTLPNQSGGVLNAFEVAGAALSDIDLIVHGTTTTTNAVLERQLSKTGLITTQGFRDVLELGRRTRPQAYGMHGRFTPVIPRDLRLEVPERMDARGRVVGLPARHLGAGLRPIAAVAREQRLPVVVATLHPLGEGLAGEVRHECDHDDPAVRGQATQHVVRDIARHVGQSGRIGVTEDDRRPRHVQYVAGRVGRGMGQVDQHARPFHPSDHRHALRRQPAVGRRTGVTVRELGGCGIREQVGANPLARQALHAAVLGFVHPVTGAAARFESTLPADMAGLLVDLRS